MSPIQLMLVGGAMYLIFVVFGILNLVNASNKNFGGALFRHFVLGVCGFVGGIGFIVGLVMFLIDVVK